MTKKKKAEKKSSDRGDKTEIGDGRTRVEEADAPKSPWRYPWEPKTHENQKVKWK